MTASLKARAGYGRDAQAIKPPKDTEYDAFARITGHLRNAAQPGTTARDLAGALHENRRLWTLLAATVASSDNALPDDLRARILYLAEFTTLHSSKVLSNEAGIEPLIEVNVAVMRGLRERSTAA
ncbi:MAG: flagellar biosynthesis regulator FlaF [Roseovarius sp.]|nr:flagellar biosynthesis regulator FlaF [Roseovarius sp.]